MSNQSCKRCGNPACAGSKNAAKKQNTKEAPKAKKAGLWQKGLTRFLQVLGIKNKAKEQDQLRLAQLAATPMSPAFATQIVRNFLNYPEELHKAAFNYIIAESRRSGATGIGMWAYGKEANVVYCAPRPGEDIIGLPYWVLKIIKFIPPQEEEDPIESSARERRARDLA